MSNLTALQQEALVQSDRMAVGLLFAACRRRCPKSTVELVKHPSSLGGDSAFGKPVNVEHISAVFEARFGNVLNTDSAKLLFRDQGYDPTSEQSVRDFHPQAAKIVTQLFEHWLATKKNVGDGTIVFLGGGNGSGKSTSAPAYSRSTFVMDSTMTSLDASKAKIQMALDAGFTPVIRFVYRNPIEAWFDGVLGRASMGGHITPKSVFSNTHSTARNVLDHMITVFGDQVDIGVIANKTGVEASIISLETLRQKPRLSKEQILEAINSSPSSG